MKKSYSSQITRTPKRAHTSEFTGDPTNMIRLRNMSVVKSTGPEGVRTAGMMGGEPFLAALMVFPLAARTATDALAYPELTGPRKRCKTIPLVVSAVRACNEPNLAVGECKANPS